jgi:hypothetical protein
MAPKGVEVTGGWRKLNDEEITWFLLLTKYKAIGGGRCVGGEYGSNERKEMHTEFWWENLMEGECLKNQGVNRNIILKFVFSK